MQPVSTDTHALKVFEFISMLENALQIKPQIMSFDVMQNTNKQVKAFEKLCNTVKNRKNNKDIIAITTLPPDNRDGPDAAHLLKEWIYLAGWDVMFYVLSDGRRKVTGNPVKIAEICEKLSAVDKANTSGTQKTTAN